MQKRRLGKSTLETAPIIFGGNVFGWTADEATSFQLLDAFLDAGFNAVDTADVYSNFVPGLKGGESETVIGNWLKARGNRSKVIIATKFGLPMADDKKGLSKKYLLSAAEASLKRLQTDYIDLFQVHRDDLVTPFEETLEGLDELIKAGKVRAIGGSNYEPERLSQILDVSAAKKLPRFETLQPKYNLYDRDEFEGALQKVCAENTISVIPYFALASGFLTGKYRSEKDLAGKSRGGFVQHMLNPRGLRILGTLDIVARDQNATPAQVALAWLMTRPTVVAPIVSAINLQQLADILKSAEIKLDSQSLKALDEASRP